MHFAPDGTPDAPLGDAALTLADLRPVADAWRIPCPEPLASALDAFLDRLGANADLVGVGVDATEGIAREALTPRRRIRFPGSGSGGAFVDVGGHLALPTSFHWFNENVEVWERLRQALGRSLEVDDDGLWAVQEVVEAAGDPRREIVREDAVQWDPEVEVGDRLQRLIRREAAGACVLVLREALEQARG